MRRRLLVEVAALMMAVTACSSSGGGGGGVPSTNPSGQHTPVTITMWSAWTGRELKQFDEIFKSFHEKYPWITVVDKGGILDNKLLAGINSGNPPDAVLSFGVDSVGEFCQSGAWIDLNPLIQQSGVDMSQFPPAALKYTSYAGSQCALPFLTDTTALYYNKDLLANAGYKDPPKTLDELETMAKKLTVQNPDGSIEVAGFVPWIGYYCCGTNLLDLGHMYGASWYDDAGKSALASDPAWTEMLNWQKDFVDWYGADNLAKFVAGAGNEFGSNNDFENGRTAMAFDGEWRTAFIANEHPELNYGTAPMPAPSDHQDLYGSGLAGGTVIGIPKGSPHEAEAWLLVQFMATDTKTLVYMANNVRNVPTTLGALNSPKLDVTPQFQTFLDVFQNPLSAYKEPVPIGTEDQDLFADLADKWQNGQIADLNGALQALATQIDNEIGQSGAGPP